MRYDVSGTTMKRLRHAHAKDMPKYEGLFIAWDGEGWSDSSGKHHYSLFGCSLGDLVAGESLGWQQCFDLLLDVSMRNPHATHVIYAGGYDVVMMLADMPGDVSRSVLRGRTVRYRGYTIQYYKRKWLHIIKGKRKVTLYDVFTFFSTSFVKACREYLGDSDLLAMVTEGKAGRDTFTYEDMSGDVVPYWEAELKLLVRLMNNLRDRLNAVDIIPTRWHGPGAVASQVLKMHKAKQYAADDVELIGLARFAYYGGRFELFQAGKAEGKVYQYDIRSAYPTAIAQLPALYGATWTHDQHPTEIDRHGLYLVTHQYDGSPTEPGLTVWRHRTGSTWYPPDYLTPHYVWGVELLAMLRMAEHRGDDLTVREGWVPTDDGTRPFTWIAEYYERRAAMKATGDPAQLALKLAINSVYGKLCQSKGARVIRGAWRLPPWHSLPWAGWVTAHTRATILDAMRLAGPNLVGVETDAVTVTEPLPLPVGTGLGAWEASELDGLLYLASGIYFRRVGDTWTFKSRGFEGSPALLDRWIDIASRAPQQQVELTATIRRFITDPRRAEFATWQTSERRARFAPDGKREHVTHLCPACAEGKSYADGLHPLVYPLRMAVEPNLVPSQSHRLPWIDGPVPPTDTIYYDDDLVQVTLEGIPL